jgi:uncharacterized membrane-anchored protein
LVHGRASYLLICRDQQSGKPLLECSELPHLRSMDGPLGRRYVGGLPIIPTDGFLQMASTHNQVLREATAKVPEVTLVFWIIKIAATTLGETGGDSVTMTWLHADANAHNGGYLIGTGIFIGVFVAAVLAQVLAKKFNPWIYWLAIVASTTVGTTMADYFDRSLGIGYAGGSSILFACVLCSLAIWYFTLGSINVQTVATPKVEIFYWVTITFSQTLGTALGDWAADSGLGYDGGALVFGAGLAVLAGLYYWTSMSRVFLFWAAFILTRPLGATVGDFLDKPIHAGGLAFSRPIASVIIAAFILGCIIVLPQRAGQHPREASA